MARATKPKPRRRLDAPAAQKGILDAAEKRLVIGGPAGIRLQDVAKDAGVSHPTVLHHFGSRELLVKAVITRALRNIHEDLVRAIAASTGELDQLASMLEGVSEALTKSGHARVLLWLALEGHPIDEADVRLTDVVDATHALRKARHSGKSRMPPRTDTAHTVVLAALALVGAAVMCPTLLGNAGLEDDDAAGKRFRAWLAVVLKNHLDTDRAG